MQGRRASTLGVLATQPAHTNSRQQNGCCHSLLFFHSPFSVATSLFLALRPLLQPTLQLHICNGSSLPLANWCVGNHNNNTGDWCCCCCCSCVLCQLHSSSLNNRHNKSEHKNDESRVGERENLLQKDKLNLLMCAGHSGWLAASQSFGPFFQQQLPSSSAQLFSVDPFFSAVLIQCAPFRFGGSSLFPSPYPQQKVYCLCRLSNTKFFAEDEGYSYSMCALAHTTECHLMPCSTACSSLCRVQDIFILIRFAWCALKTSSPSSHFGC